MYEIWRVDFSVGAVFIAVSLNAARVSTDLVTDLLLCSSWSYFERHENYYILINW
jgi:hypothetical protein